MPYNSGRKYQSALDLTLYLSHTQFTGFLLMVVRFVGLTLLSQLASRLLKYHRLRALAYFRNAHHQDRP